MKNAFQLVDQLGIVKAQIADLEEKERDLIEAVKREALDSGVAVVEGVLFRAALVITERTGVNSAAVQERFPAAEYPDLYKQSISESLRVSAR